MDPVISFDTETDRRPGEKLARTVLIQTCPLEAISEKAVRLYIGEDCYDQFFADAKASNNDVIVRCYNLSNYEWSRMASWVIEHCGKWIKRDMSKGGKRHPEPGEWTCMEDQIKFYNMEICFDNGRRIKFVDDMLKLPMGYSMKTTALSAYRKHPEWFPFGEAVKLDWTDYNNGWYYCDNKKQEFLEYAIRDAYSQAMIARYLDELGLMETTIASHGINKAIMSEWGQGKNLFTAKENFRQKYPVLPRQMQDIVEESIQGGFVYGKTGHWRGDFRHLDYSSSYPKEYYIGEMFEGAVQRIKGDARDKVSDKFFKWYYCSFDFSDMKYLPAISAKLCGFNIDINKKMRAGHVEKRLFTKGLFDEICRHYHVYNVVIHEVWFAKRRVGVTPEFIKFCYEEKAKAEKGSLERDVAKTKMNGGVHGKTITKTHRKYGDYSTGKRVWKEEVNDPQYCSLIGFTGMSNARERLLADCRAVMERGYDIYMCDTDSMVTDCPKSVLDELFTYADTKTIKDLGRFEMEVDKDDGSTDFDEFRCWGLKRYCESNKGKFRKSAFAGMHDKQQRKLMDMPTDGTVFEWEQTLSKVGEYGKEIYEGTKHAKAENIWFDPQLPKKGKKVDVDMAINKWKEYLGMV